MPALANCGEKAPITCMYNQKEDSLAFDVTVKMSVTMLRPPLKQEKAKTHRVVDYSGLFCENVQIHKY